jgi:hypothetical protein
MKKIKMRNEINKQLNNRSINRKCHYLQEELHLLQI